MLSFASSFRAVARRQACKVPGVRAMTSASAQTTTVGENPYSEISDYIHDIAEEQKTIAAGSTGEVVEGGDTVPEARRTCNPCCSIPLTSKPCVASPIGAKGFPTLTGFRTNQVRNASIENVLGAAGCVPRNVFLKMFCVLGGRVRQRWLQGLLISWIQLNSTRPWGVYTRVVRVRFGRDSRNLLL